MKLLYKVDSKRGHREKDYLLTVSPKELLMIRYAMRKVGKPIEKKDHKECERNAFKSVLQFFVTTKL